MTKRVDTGTGASTPRYLELRRLLRHNIETGEYQPGAAIPSLNELAAEHDVNRLTILKAVEPLIGEGLLKPVVGRGFYVVGEAVARELETLDGFTHTMTQRDAHPSTKILTKALRVAGSKYSDIFGVPVDAQLCYLKRLCLTDGNPFSLEEILFPADVLPDLDELEPGVFSLYELFSFYGVTLARAWQTLDLTTVEQKDARTLGIDTATPVMLFECTSYDDSDRVVEFTRTYTRSDRANFVIHFTN